MPLKPNFSCDNLKSLLCGIQIPASFAHDEIARPGVVGPIMFLLNGKLDGVAFDFLQHSGIGLDFKLFDIVGTLFSHDSSSAKLVCRSCRSVGGVLLDDSASCCYNHCSGREVLLCGLVLLLFCSAGHLVVRATVFCTLCGAVV